MENSGEGNKGSNSNDSIYSKRIGIRNYTLVENEETKRLIEGIILTSSNKLRELLDGKNGKNISEEERKKIIIKIVSEEAVNYMRSGLSVFRVFLGGRYNLQDVLNAVSCIDASIIIKRALEEGFGIESEIMTTRLGVVKAHHYLEIKINEDVMRIDPILRTKRNKGGVFYSKETHERFIDNFNSLGMKGICRQLFRFIRQKK